jgi:hypothetical protein
VREVAGAEEVAGAAVTAGLPVRGCTFVVISNFPI